MPGPKKVALAEILAAVEQQLLDRRVVSVRTQIVQSVRKDPGQFNAARDLVLRPGRALAPPLPNQNTGLQAAAGRRDGRVRRLLTVEVRTANQLGGTNDKQWIAQHFPVEDGVLDALWDFYPVDRDGNLLLVTPLALVASEDAQRTPEGSAYGDSSVSFEMVYYPLITPADEAPLGPP
jgi:hypothetical protein